MPSDHAMHYKVSKGINSSIKKNDKMLKKKKKNVLSAVKNVEFAPLCKEIQGSLRLATGGLIRCSSSIRILDTGTLKPTPAPPFTLYAK